MDILDIMGRILTIILSASAVAGILAKPLYGTMDRLKKIEESTAHNTAAVKQIAKDQSRATLNSSMQKIEIKQELNATINESELVELKGQFIEYKKQGGNGHMEARYQALMMKVGNHGL